MNHQEQLRVDKVEESEQYTLQFPLASLTAPVLIDNIFYDFDKATLRPESAQALDQLVTMLKENPHRICYTIDCKLDFSSDRSDLSDGSGDAVLRALATAT